MSEEIAIIKAKIEEIRTDISELKTDNKEMMKAISKLAFVDDKFKSNEEAHKLIWDKLHKLEDMVSDHGIFICHAREQKANRDKLVIGIITNAILALAGWMLYLYKVLS